MGFRSKCPGREVADFRLGEEEQQVANLLVADRLEGNWMTIYSVNCSLQYLNFWLEGPCVSPPTSRGGIVLHRQSVTHLLLLTNYPKIAVKFHNSLS